MIKYRKKPVIIEAIQLDEAVSRNDTGGAWWTDVYQWAESLGGDTSEWVGCSSDGIEIPTLEGVMLARKGDWIIRGVRGEFYICNPDIFEATYERIDNDTST